MKKPRKTAMLRARCEMGLKEDVETVARLKNLDPADIIRISVGGYVAQFKLPPIQDAPAWASK